MRIYPMPLELDKEDKIFGGKFSLRQAVIFLIGAGLTMVAFIELYKFTNIVYALTVAAIIGVLSFFAANFNKNGMTIDKYIVFFFSYVLNEKKYLWKGSADSEKDS
jgi:hypothetical protein